MSQARRTRHDPARPKRKSVWRAGFRSLQFKASLLVVLAVVAVTAVCVIVGTRSLALTVYENEYARSLEWANSLAAGASTEVEEQDHASLTQTVNDLVDTRAVALAVFADREGRVLAAGEEKPGLLEGSLTAAGQLKIEPLHEPRLVWHEALGLAVADVVVPVYSDVRLRVDRPASRPIVGYLRLAPDITYAKQQVERLTVKLSLIAIGLVLLSVPCSLLVTRQIVRPLNDLTRTAKAIASGSTEARAHIRTNSEIGEVAEAFNTMADRLTSSQLELLELNAELERRVQERTVELEELAAREPLTGLHNRRYFSEVIAREFAAAERYDADLTCLMFDLDHFKQINDQYGHRAGDEILIAISNAIKSELRSSDVAARFGGDEFIVLLPQTSSTAASMLVDRIVSRFNREVAENLPGVPGEVSIGVASLRTTRARSAEALIHEADLALYAAKEGRRTLADQTTAKKTTGATA